MSVFLNFCVPRHMYVYAAILSLSVYLFRTCSWSFRCLYTCISRYTCQCAFSCVCSCALIYYHLYLSVSQSRPVFLCMPLFTSSSVFASVCMKVCWVSVMLNFSVCMSVCLWRCLYVFFCMSFSLYVFDCSFSNVSVGLCVSVCLRVPFSEYVCAPVFVPDTVLHVFASVRVSFLVCVWLYLPHVVAFPFISLHLVYMCPC